MTNEIFIKPLLQDAFTSKIFYNLIIRVILTVICLNVFKALFQYIYIVQISCSLYQIRRVFYYWNNECATNEILVTLI